MPNKELFGWPMKYCRPASNWPEPDESWELDDIASFIRRKSAMNQNTLATLARAASEQFKGDATKPGVLVSWLPNEGVYYVAVHRYFNSAGRQKEIVASTKNADAETAVADVARMLLDIVGVKESDIERLRRLVK